MNGGGCILVVGAAGRLGGALMRRLSGLGRPHRGLTRDDLDLEATEAIRPLIEKLRPGAVLNAAAYNDVDGAETVEGRASAMRVNRDAPRELARACRGLGIPFVHVSTDYVFDGSLRRPYREDDPPAPLQVYGRSKHEGERATLGEHRGALVVRTSAVFGPGPHPGFVDLVLRFARERGVVEIVEPPTASTTYSIDLAATLLDLVEAGASGLFHVVNEGHCTRLELARAALRIAGVAREVEIRLREPDHGRALRPRYSVLDDARLRVWRGRGLRSWGEALAAYLGERAGG